MSYSAFFTAGLKLASHPREYESFAGPHPSPLTINVHPATPRRTRKRRSSLTIATSPISTIKTSGRNATDAAKNALRTASPRDATFLDTLQNGTRPKMPRRLTVSHMKDLPSLPAPTSPLPTLPNLRVDLSIKTSPYPSSLPMTPTEDAYPSSPIVADPPSRTTYHVGSLRANPSRKSSLLLPVAIARVTLSPNAYAGNVSTDNLNDNLTEEKNAPAAVWYDDDEDMQNDGDVRVCAPLSL